MKQNRWMKAMKLFIVVVCCSLCMLSFTTCAKENDDFDDVLKIEHEQGIMVYPNPAISQFSVSFFGLGNGKTNIQLFNAVGQQVYSTSVNAYGYGSIHVSVGNLPSGSYLLRVLGSDRAYTTKVIVL